MLFCFVLCSLQFRKIVRILETSDSLSFTRNDMMPLKTKKTGTQGSTSLQQGPAVLLFKPKHQKIKNYVVEKPV